VWLREVSMQMVLKEIGSVYIGLIWLWTMATGRLLQTQYWIIVFFTNLMQKFFI